MKEEEYNLHTRHHIPKDYKGCWNCRYMQWMVALGQGARCSNCLLYTSDAADE